MIPRSFQRLAGVGEEELVASLSKGMNLIAEHIAVLEGDIRPDTSPRAAAAIRVISDDEAGKYLILLDVARCARQPKKIVSDQLRSAGQHLAKGIYARAADINPADFAELVRYCCMLRESHRLDGPNDVDWIFRNEIEADREERLYVDFVHTDEGDRWYTPKFWDDTHSWAAESSGAVKLVSALHRSMFDTTDGLQAVVEVWKDFSPKSTTRWNELVPVTQMTLGEVATVNEGMPEQPDAARIVNDWTFPLWGVELKMITKNLSELRRSQDEWHPDL